MLSLATVLVSLRISRHPCVLRPRRPQKAKLIGFKYFSFSKILLLRDIQGSAMKLVIAFTFFGMFLLAEFVEPKPGVLDDSEDKWPTVLYLPYVTDVVFVEVNQE
ncbi:hypothetical protein ACROYT_G012478 [Oculina patagonica]